MVKKYIPEKGDIIWISLDPAYGREQKGRRPALVLSSKSFNTETDLAFVCPITSTAKPYPTRIEISLSEIKGFIMTEQLCSLDWKKRKADFIESAPTHIIESVVNCISVILE